MLDYFDKLYKSNCRYVRQGNVVNCIGYLREYKIKSALFMGVLLLMFSNIGCTPSFRSPKATTDTTAAALASEPTAPNAPLNVVALVGNQQASVSFTEPASDGGSAITGYTVTSSPGGFTGFGSSSPIVVSGLTNGTAYTFTVTATNANGTSIPSTASTAIIPATVPGAPTAAVGTLGNANPDASRSRGL